MLPTTSTIESALTGCEESTPALSFLRILGAFCDTPFADTAEAIDTALEIVMRHVSVRTAFVTQAVNGLANVLHAQDDSGCGIPAGAVVPQENTFCQYVRATDRPVVIPNSGLDPRTVQVSARIDFNMVAYIGVPIHLGNGELYGTLCAADPEPQDFRPEHVELMRVLAQRLASLIEQQALAQRYESVQREAKAALHAAQQTLDQQTTVMSVVAHDLRTPLTSVRGFVELMANDVFGPVWPKQREALERVRANLQWMQRLSNDMLDVASLDTKTFVMLTDEYNPSRIAQNVVEMCQVQARERGLQLQYKDVGIIQPVIGDGDRVQQVLLNLVGNALRYTEHGGVKVTVSNCIDGVEFSVSDTGPGIAAEQQDTIWQRGVRAIRVGRGAGLGLYVVKQLVAAMGGTVGVKSEPGKGSTFWFRLPAYGPAPHAAVWN